MAVGFTLERVAYRPLRRAPRLAPLITAIGLSIILQHVAMIIWSRNPLSYPQIIQSVPYHLTGNPNGATITNVQIAIIVTSVVMMGGLVALVYAIIEAPEEGWTDPMILSIFALAIVVLGAFALWERHTPSPMLDTTFFRNPRFTAASAGIMLLFFSM